MHAETHSNSVPLVSWPLATPFCAKCAYFECLNLGGQSIKSHQPDVCFGGDETKVYLTIVAGDGNSKAEFIRRHRKKLAHLFRAAVDEVQFASMLKQQSPVITQPDRTPSEISQSLIMLSLKIINNDAVGSPGAYYIPSEVPSVRRPGPRAPTHDVVH